VGNPVPLIAKAQAIAQLRALGRQHRIVRRADMPNPLYLALRVYFRTLHAAREAAGLVQPSGYREWSLQRVVRELRRLHRAGVRMCVPDLIEAGERKLVFAIYQYAGNIERARRLARVPTPPRRVARDPQPWDEARVIDEIRDLHADGRSLAFSKADPRLVSAGRKLFGSWADAVDAAGFDYAKVRLVRERYRRKEVLELLRELAKRRPTMTLDALNKHRLGRIVRKLFGSIAAGVRAAGVAGWPKRQKYGPMAKRDVTARLRARKRAGKRVHRYAVLRDDPKLARSGLAHWGVWTRVLAAARLPDDSPRSRWSAKAVVARLRARRAAGKSLRPSKVRAEDNALRKAAIRHFGSYRAAALELGVETSRAWTREKVITELRRRAGRANRVSQAEAGGRLRSAAKRTFGTFSKACRAAGLAVYAV
jgi:hypothetical protein